MGKLLMRRRELIQTDGGEIWIPLSTTDYKNWRRSQCSLIDDDIVVSPSSNGWVPYVVVSPLAYKWSQVKNGKVRITADYEITGFSSGSGVVFSVATFSDNNARSTRIARADMPRIYANGSGHYNETRYPINLGNGTPSDSQYFGMIMYFNANAKSTLKIRNLTFEYSD